VQDVNQAGSKEYHLQSLQHIDGMKDGLNRFMKDVKTIRSGLQTKLGSAAYLSPADIGTDDVT
jgi:hypothetical protein